jgi:predicted N-acetyltransferase YhbS
MRPPFSVNVREELPDDIPAIREVNVRAFEQEQEANIVNALRRNGAALLSLVATKDGHQSDRRRVVHPLDSSDAGC